MDEVTRLLKVLEETRNKLHKALGLPNNEWRTPDDFTDRYWCWTNDRQEKIIWSDDPITLDKLTSDGIEFSALARYDKNRIVKNYTVVELDHMQDSRNPDLTVFVNNKQCKDPAVKKWLEEHE
jgi:hypothetical protein